MFNVNHSEHMELAEKDLKAWVLDKLSRHGHWEHRHTSVDHLPKGAPPHLAKKIKEIAKGLIKDGLLRVKPTGYGTEVSLNFAKREEILKLIERWKLQR